MAHHVDKEIEAPGQQCVNEQDARGGIKSCPRINSTLRWEPAQDHAKDHDEREAKHEDRDADAKEAHTGNQSVSPAAHLSGSQTAQGNPYADGEEERAKGELNGAREPSQKLGEKWL